MNLREEMFAEEILSNFVRICEKKFCELFHYFPIRKIFFREIDYKCPFANINSAKIGIFSKKFSAIILITINSLAAI